MLACASVLLSACSSVSAPVNWTHAPGCFDASLPGSYTLVMHDMPGYFAPIMADGVDAAMRKRGLTQAALGDVRIIMRFEMLDLDPPPPPRDPLGESMLQDDTLNFMARVDVTVLDAGGTERWAGTLSRVHSINGDEVIHRPRAVAMIGTAIDALFDDFPRRCGPAQPSGH